MKGFNTFWTPGFDHAGLATQVVVEKRLRASKGLTRHDVGRKAFLKEAEAWKDLKRSRMKTQLRSLGAMLDWEDEYYTMGEVSFNEILRILTARPEFRSVDLSQSVDPIHRL